MSNADKTKSRFLDEMTVLRDAIAEYDRVAVYRDSAAAVADHFLHLLADALPDAVLELQYNGTTGLGPVTYINDAASDTFGYCLDALLCESPAVLFADVSEYEALTGRISDAVDSTLPQLCFDFSCKHENGRIFTATAVACFLYRDGVCIRVYVVVRDRTEKDCAGGVVQFDTAHLESIFRTTPVGILVVENCIISMANESFCSITGYTQAELRGNSPRMLFFSDEEYDGITCLGKDGCQAGIERDIESRILHKCGEERNVVVHCAPLFPEKPNSGVALSILDITEKKQYERRLETSEARYRDLFESMTNCVAVYEPVDNGEDFIFKDFNRSAENLEHIERDELLGKRVTEVFPGVRKFGLFELLSTVSRTGKPMNHGPSFYRDGQRVGWRENHVYRLTTGEVVAIYQDVTDRKLAEEERDWFFNLSIDMLSIVELKGAFRQVNPAWTNNLGWSREELMSRPPMEFVHPDDRESQRNAFESLLAGKKVMQHESRFLCKDGSVRWISCNMFPLPEEGLAFNVGRDITERKYLEAQLNQAQKMEAIGTLAGGIAHDFNNILGVIIGYADMSMECDLPSDGPLYDYLKQIEKAGQRAKELIGQILTFSRKTEAQKQVLQLDTLLKESMKMLRATLPSTISISQNIQSELCTIDADPSQIHRLIINLCTNSAHAMQENGGVLTVELVSVLIKEKTSICTTVLQPGRYVRISISDTGTGIAPDNIDRIFEPYFTTKPQGEGTGMGLAVVHGVVNAHGGGLDVESAVGKGARFDVYFPFKADVPFAYDEDEESTDDSIAEETILFVDDERVVVEMTRSMLERVGYNVYSTTDSIEALNYFRENADSVDLLITDQTMPVMTGMDLAKEVLRIKPELSILLCTGYSDQVTPERIERIGIAKLLMKPFSMRVLRKTIRELLSSGND